MKYTVRYHEENYIEKEIEANSPEEAEEKMWEMVTSGEIDLSYAELANSGCEVINDKCDNEK